MKKLIALIVGFVTFAASAQAALKAGDAVPDFSAPLSDGTTFHLKDWLGKAPLVLYFYPKDDTPGCTVEACALRDESQAFRNLKATVVGASYDSVASHQKFIKKYNLPFPLIADETKSVATLFGVNGKMFANRATFVIGKDGKILYANPSVDPKTHAQEIRAVLEKLSAAKK